jgi:hypothetical protein
MTGAERAGWLGIVGLVALAGLGALLEGGGRRVANPRRARRRNPAPFREGAVISLSALRELSLAADTTNDIAASLSVAHPSPANVLNARRAAAAADRAHAAYALAAAKADIDGVA